MYQQIVSDKLQGVIRNPFAFYFPIQRGFSGSVGTLPLCPYANTSWLLVYVRVLIHSRDDSC